MVGTLGSPYALPALPALEVLRISSDLLGYPQLVVDSPSGTRHCGSSRPGTSTDQTRRK